MTKYIRATIFLVVIIAIFSVFIYSIPQVSNADPAGDVRNGTADNYTEAGQGSVLAEGGNTTEVNVSVLVSTQRWQGYYGRLNQSLVLGQDTNIFFRFSITNVSLLIVSQNASITNAAGILGNESRTLCTSCTNFTAVALADTVWGFSGQDSDSVNRTYNDFKGNMSIGGINSTLQFLDHVNLTNSSGQNVFQPAIAIINSVNATGATSASNYLKLSFAFLLNVSNPAIADFKGTTSNYEIMVPVETQGTSETYYFFLDVT